MPKTKGSSRATVDDLPKEWQNWPFVDPRETPDLKGLIDTFAHFVAEELGIEKRGFIFALVKGRTLPSDGGAPRVGEWRASSGAIAIARDQPTEEVLLTVAEELTHEKQKELGIIQPVRGADSAAVTREAERQADAVARGLLKEFKAQR